MSTVVVVAKEPVPGRVKTRLCPPLRPDEAAAVAAAALADTLDAAAACGADRRLLVLDGEPGAWLPGGFDVVPQVPGGLAERLAAAWSHVDGPAVQIGMDTPQVRPAYLDDALASVVGHDAALGPAHDGGWWGLALRTPRTDVFTGVPMSTDRTSVEQKARLERLGLDVVELRELRDIDDVADLRAVAAIAPWSRTAALARELPALERGRREVRA